MGPPGRSDSRAAPLSRSGREDPTASCSSQVRLAHVFITLLAQGAPVPPYQEQPCAPPPPCLPPPRRCWRCCPARSWDSWLRPTARSSLKFLGSRGRRRALRVQVQETRTPTSLEMQSGRWTESIRVDFVITPHAHPVHTNCMSSVLAVPFLLKMQIGKCQVRWN